MQGVAVLLVVCASEIYHLPRGLFKLTWCQKHSNHKPPHIWQLAEFCKCGWNGLGVGWWMSGPSVSWRGSLTKNDNCSFGVLSRWIDHCWCNRPGRYRSPRRVCLVVLNLCCSCRMRTFVSLTAMEEKSTNMLQSWADCQCHSFTGPPWWTQQIDFSRCDTASEPADLSSGSTRLQSDFGRCDATKQSGEIDLWRFLQSDLSRCDIASEPADFDLWTPLQSEFSRCDATKQPAGFYSCSWFQGELWIQCSSHRFMAILLERNVHRNFIEGCQTSSEGGGGVLWRREGGFLKGGWLLRRRRSFFEGGRGGLLRRKRASFKKKGGELVHPSSLPHRLFEPSSLSSWRSPPFFEEPPSPFFDETPLLWRSRLVEEASLPSSSSSWGGAVEPFYRPPPPYPSSTKPPPPSRSIGDATLIGAVSLEQTNI